MDYGYLSSRRQPGCQMWSNLWESWSFISGLPGGGHCKMFTPVYAEAAAQMAGKVRFAKLNCDENSSMAVQCKVTGTRRSLFTSTAKRQTA